MTIVLSLATFDAIMTLIIDYFRSELYNTFAEIQEESIMEQKQYKLTNSNAYINSEDNNIIGEEESTQNLPTPSTRGGKVPTDSIRSYMTMLPISTCNLFDKILSNFVEPFQLRERI